MIGRVVTLNHRDAQLQAIREAIGQADGVRLVQHPRIEGLDDVDEVFVMRST
jgi:hypothetical protein